MKNKSMAERFIGEFQTIHEATFALIRDWIRQQPENQKMFSTNEVERVLEDFCYDFSNKPPHYNMPHTLDIEIWWKEKQELMK